ncbi:hypothetical protein ECP03052931_3134 [Escherichia coli p0305293.1]|nr:hypothetical protein ECP03052931_3134 [Escherichia coli p0305293.1]
MCHMNNQMSTPQRYHLSFEYQGFWEKCRNRFQQELPQ